MVPMEMGDEYLHLSVKAEVCLEHLTLNTFSTIE
jgi:hypothetical protein